MNDMKKNKAIYISLLFLFCFSAAISLNTVRNIHILLHQTEALGNKSTSTHSFLKTHRQSNQVPFLIMDKKENETETEKLLTIASSALMLDISFFQTKVSYTSVFFGSFQENTNANPIYIAIRNLRI